MDGETIQPKRFNPLSDYCMNSNFMKPEECDKWIEKLSALPLNEAAVDMGYSNEIRKSKVSIVHRDETFGYIYDDIQEFITSCNDRFFNFDISGFEPIQYLVYDEIGNHFATHIDASHYYEPGIDRKLSFVLQLSDPDEYDGGDLQLWRFANEYQSVTKQKGKIVLFSSLTPHRVTPITRGIRRSLVGWVYGPYLK